MPRFLLFAIPLLGLAGCASQSGISQPISLASLHPNPNSPAALGAQRRAAAVAELNRPAPALAELPLAANANFSSPPADPVAQSYVLSLTDNRPKRGLVVCEPLQGTKTNAFAAGCSRWMNALGAGSPAFEVVPTWGATEDFQHLKGWNSLALDQKRAVELGQGLDASHVAFGTYDGKKLQYQVADIRKTPTQIVGTFSIQGAPAQLITQLPGLTQQIVKATGVQGVQIPAQVGLNADDLTLLGTLPRKLIRIKTLSSTQSAHLSRLATNPLGAIFVGRTPGIKPRLREVAAQTLLSLASSNALAAGELVLKLGDSNKRTNQTLQTLAQKYPRNQIIALGNAQLYGAEGKYIPATRSAERAVRTAPHSALAWNILADALSDQAEDIRQGATWNGMTSNQQSSVQIVYPQAQTAAWRAVDLDPKIAPYWTELSATSLFNNDDAWARSALGKALVIDPSDEDALNWGLQILHPKWGGDANSFATMARFAVAHAGQGNLNGIALYDGLKETDQKMLARPLFQKLVAKEPDNPDALRLFSYTTRMDLGDFKAALPYARRAVQLAPDDTNALTELADIEQHDLGQYEASIKLFQHAIKLEPSNPLHWVNMALSYAKWGKKAEARTYAIKGHALGYSGPHPVWAMVGLGQDGSVQ